MPTPSHRRSLLTTATLLIVAFLASPRAAGAIKIQPPAMPHLDQMLVAEGKVWFIQPDGMSTALDLATGTVLERGAPAPRDAEPAPTCGWALNRNRNVCPFPDGVLTTSWEDGPVIELRSSRSVSQTLNLKSRLRGQFWIANGRLLLEDPSFGVATLECVDFPSGRSLWIYAYPSLPADSTLFDTELVAEAHRRLEGLLSRNPADPGWMVVDPLPARDAEVRQRVAWGWVLLSLLGFGVAASSWKLATAHQPAWLGAASSVALAAFLLYNAHLDLTLALSALLLFVAGSILALVLTARSDKGPRRVLWLVLIGTVSLLALDFLYRLGLLTLWLL